jgi:hypothetical protein
LSLNWPIQEADNTLNHGLDTTQLWCRWCFNCKSDNGVATTCLTCITLSTYCQCPGLDISCPCLWTCTCDLVSQSDHQDWWWVAFFALFYCCHTGRIYIYINTTFPLYSRFW